jgi:hypothetical protein
MSPKPSTEAAKIPDRGNDPRRFVVTDTDLEIVRATPGRKRQRRRPPAAHAAGARRGRPSRFADLTVRIAPGVRVLRCEGGCARLRCARRVPGPFHAH